VTDYLLMITADQRSSMVFPDAGGHQWLDLESSLVVGSSWTYLGMEARPKLAGALKPDPIFTVGDSKELGRRSWGTLDSCAMLDRNALLFIALQPLDDLDDWGGFLHQNGSPKASVFFSPHFPRDQMALL
jgi:hypothetical protein